MPKTNFLFPAIDNPQRSNQRAYNYDPFVKILQASDPAALEIAVNDYLDSLALPFDPDRQYFIRETRLSSAREANNTVSYSVMLHMELWEPS